MDKGLKKCLNLFHLLPDLADSENNSKRKQRPAGEPSGGAPDGEETELDTSDAGGQPEADGEPEPEVELIFKPLAIEKGDVSLMQTRFIKTTMNATVDHLAKYLSMRHLLDCKAAGQSQADGQLLQQVNREASLFTIYLAAGPGEFKPLQGQTSLEQVSDKYWRANKPLELHYAYKMPAV